MLTRTEERKNHNAETNHLCATWSKWDKDKKGARSTHERPSRLHPNSVCTSVDHLLTRQERRSPNVRNILRAVNGFYGRGGRVLNVVTKDAATERVGTTTGGAGQHGELNSPLQRTTIKKWAGQAQPLQKREMVTR